MDKGTYENRKRELKSQIHVGHLTGIIFGGFLWWTGIGLYIGWKGYKMGKNAKAELIELENEFDQQELQVTAV